MKNYNVEQIKKLLNGAKTAFIAVPQLSVDSLGAALALATSLKKNNINVQVFCPQKPDNNYSKLSGLDLVTDVYNQNDLIITLDYPLDSIENVSYNNDNDHLNLVIKTKLNSSKIENSQVLINSQSSSADVSFMLGDESLLGPNAIMTNKGNWILITPTNSNKAWAKSIVVDQDAPFSEILSFLLPMIGLNLDSDSAKNLLIGLRVATQSFSINVSPETFEAGAICLRGTQFSSPVEEFKPSINQSTSIPMV